MGQFISSSVDELVASADRAVSAAISSVGATSTTSAIVTFGGTKYSLPVGVIVKTAGVASIVTVALPGASAETPSGPQPADTTILTTTLTVTRTVDRSATSPQGSREEQSVSPHGTILTPEVTTTPLPTPLPSTIPTCASANRTATSHIHPDLRIIIPLVVIILALVASNIATWLKFKSRRAPQKVVLVSSQTGDIGESGAIEYQDEEPERPFSDVDRSLPGPLRKETQVNQSGSSLEQQSSQATTIMQKLKAIVTAINIRLEVRNNRRELERARGYGWGLGKQEEKLQQKPKETETFDPSPEYTKF